MFGAAQLVGEAVRRMYGVHGEAMKAQSVSFDVAALLGGQIRGRGMRLFQIYSAGNFIEATEDTPFLQIGEHKYGKPILDRAASYDTDPNDAVKLALISMDSTLRSNLTVGLPIDLLVYRRDALKVALAQADHRGRRLFPRVAGARGPGPCATPIAPSRGRTGWSSAYSAADEGRPERIERRPWTIRPKPKPNPRRSRFAAVMERIGVDPVRREAAVVRRRDHQFDHAGRAGDVEAGAAADPRKSVCSTSASVALAPRRSACSTRDQEGEMQVRMLRGERGQLRLVVEILLVAHAEEQMDVAIHAGMQRACARAT